MTLQKRRVSSGLWQIFTLVLFTVFCLGLFAENPSREAFNAAKTGLSQFMSQDSLPEGFPLGEVDKATRKRISVSYGFQVYTVKPDGLAQGKSGRLFDLIEPTGIWRFVLKNGEQPLGLVTVANIEGQFRTVSIGGVGLAEEVNNVLKAFPKEKGYGFRFVRIYQAKADLMEIHRGSERLGFAPLKSARMALDMDSHGLGSGSLVFDSEIVEPLRRIVSKEIKRALRPEENVKREY